MNKSRLIERLDVLQRALIRFQAILNNPDLKYNDQLQDCAIQRFEFSFELCWKTLKIFLLDQGIESAGPKDVLQKSFQIGFITDETLWIEMSQARNLMSHVYDAAEAWSTINKMHIFLPTMELMLKTLAKYQ